MNEAKQRLSSLDLLDPPEQWSDIERRTPVEKGSLAGYPPSSAMGRRVRAGLAAAAVFVLAAGFAWVGLRHLTSRPAAEDRSARIGVPTPQAMAAGDGAVWVVSTSANDNQLWRIDPVTNRTRLVPGTTGVFGGPAVGEGATWVVTCQPSSTLECATSTLLKIDPASGRVIDRAELPSGGFTTTAGLGYVWVTTNDSLLKVDPVSLRVVATLPGRFEQVGIADGYLWTLGGATPGLHQIDPTSNRVVRVIDVHATCTLLATKVAVWATSCQGGLPPGSPPDHLVAVDPATGKLIYRVAFNFGELSYDGAHLWVSRATNSGASIQQLEPTTGSPTGVVLQVASGSHPWIQHGIGPAAIFTVVESKSFWLTHLDANDVVRVPVPHS
jgi:hypothetical protein